MILCKNSNLLKTQRFLYASPLLSRRGGLAFIKNFMQKPQGKASVLCLHTIQKEHKIFKKVGVPEGEIFGFRLAFVYGHPTKQEVKTSLLLIERRSNQ